MPVKNIDGNTILQFLLKTFFLFLIMQSGLSGMQADVTLGEQKGGLQAPHVIKVGNVYYMFYGDWTRICLAKIM